MGNANFFLVSVISSPCSHAYKAAACSDLIGKASLNGRNINENVSKDRFDELHRTTLRGLVCLCGNFPVSWHKIRGLEVCTSMCTSGAIFVCRKHSFTTNRKA